MTKKIYYSSILTHNYVGNMMKNPPEGYEVITPNENNKKETINKLKKNKTIKFLYRKILRRFFNVWKYMNKNPTPTPENTDIIFTVDSIVREEKPWIIKILDSPYSMAGNDYKLFIKNKKDIEEALEKNNCKAIIVHTRASMKLMKKYFNDKIISKTVLLTPAIPLEIKQRAEKDKKRFNILFMGSTNNPEAFYQKGGVETLETFKKLAEKYDNVRLVMRTKVPEKIREEYKHLKNVEFLERRLSDEELAELYQKTDILLSPGYNYFIMTFLEVFSYGIPIVGLDTYGVNEFIEDGKNGFLVKPSKMLPMDKPEFITEIGTDKYNKIIDKKDPEVINNLVNKIIILINDRELVKKFGEECQRMILEKYSYEEKNKKLKEIFDKATR